MMRAGFISLLLLLLCVSQAFAEVMVIVRREAQAAGNYVRICDIARIEGPREQVSEVGRTVLGPTPSRGQTLEISRWDIESRLFEMGIAERITFSGNDVVKVYGGGSNRRSPPTAEEIPLQALNPFGTRIDPAMALRTGSGDTAAKPAPDSLASQNQLLPKSSLSERPAVAEANPAAVVDSMPEAARERVSQVVSQYLADRYKRPDIEVESRILSLTAPVAYEAYDIAVDEALGGRVPGKATLKLKVTEHAGAEPVEVMVAADTEVFARAPVAAKQLYKGDVLSAKDVMVKRIKMGAGKSYLPPNARAVEGRELVSNLAVGEPVLASIATPTEAVKRGEIVIVFKKDGVWEVRANAKAMGSGMIGDVITVQDTFEKRKKYNARITGRGMVEPLVNNWRSAR